MSDNKKPPYLNPKYASQVSQYRQAQLSNELHQGLWRESLHNDPQITKTSLGQVSSLTTKLGQSSSGASNGSWRGSNDTGRQIQPLYSPLYLDSNLNLPRDMASINAWSRAFFALNPIVRNAINLHSTYPISKLTIKCHDAKIEQVFNDMADELDLLNVCISIAQEYWLLGESFPYAELDERNNKWSKIIVQNPDYMIVNRTNSSGEPIILMKPDENLRRIVTSTKPSDIAQKMSMDPLIIEFVKRGQNIPLDNLNITHIANKIAPYSSRGTGLLVSCFRTLMLIDQLRECKYVQATEFVNPLTIVKIGNEQERPQPADLEAWRNTFAAATSDKNFKIFTHAGVAVERVGASGAILDTSNDNNALLKELYAGLMIPQVIIEGGGDITYANGGVSLDVLKQRYMSFRSLLTSWLRRKIFYPIAKLNDFYTHTGGDKKLIIPDVEWNHMSLFETTDYINALQQGLEKGDVSKQSYQRSLGLDYKDEIAKRRKENIQAAIEEKEKEALKAMSLSQLRALDVDSDIPDVADEKLPGEVSSESKPNEDKGPDLSSPPPGMPTT